MRDDQLTLLREKLTATWEENEGDVILFLWQSALENETMDILGIKDMIDITSLVDQEVEDKTSKYNKEK